MATNPTKPTKPKPHVTLERSGDMEAVKDAHERVEVARAQILRLVRATVRRPDGVDVEALFAELAVLVGVEAAQVAELRRLMEAARAE